MACLAKKPDLAPSNGADGADSDSDSASDENRDVKLPEFFTDPGYSLLSTSVLSTSNCGNPALRLFGFGPVVENGMGIGYIPKVSHRCHMSETVFDKSSRSVCPPPPPRTTGLP